MSRLLSDQPDPAAVEALLGSEAILSALLLEMRFASGTVRVSDWNVPFTDLRWGHEWIGFGELAGMAEVSGGDGELAPYREYVLGMPWDYLDSAAQAATEQLGSSMVLRARIAEAVQDRADFLGREATLYLQLFDAERTPVGYPMALDTGIMDRAESSFTGEGAFMRMRVEGLMARSGRPIYGFLTDRDQRRRHPGDRGLRFVTELMVGKTAKWTDW